MRLADKTGTWDNGKILKGKKKNYEVTLYYSTVSLKKEVPYWYYTLNKSDKKYTYNSLWDSLKYFSQEECVAACEKKIDEITKGR